MNYNTHWEFFYTSREIDQLRFFLHPVFFFLAPRFESSPHYWDIGDSLRHTRVCIIFWKKSSCIFMNSAQCSQKTVFTKTQFFFFSIIIIIIARHYNIISKWAWNECDEFNIQVCPFYIYEFKTSHIVSLRTFHPKLWSIMIYKNENDSYDSRFKNLSHRLSISTYYKNESKIISTFISCHKRTILAIAISTCRW